MSNYLIRRLVLFGAISILGILSIQSYWLYRAFSLKDAEFNQTVTMALYDVAQKISEWNNAELPKHNLVQRKSSNYYAVNINDFIDSNILEDFLIREFEEKAVGADFEYAVFDCHSEELVYGSFCKLNHLDHTKEGSKDMSKFDNLTYYFVVKFPHRTAFLISNMWQNIIFSLITLFALGFFSYSMWVILQQKKLSELQKDFINNMTHEFKTPISSIKIASDYLKKDPHLQSNSRLKKYTEIISDQNERLNNQVEKVLSLARLESDNFKLSKESFDVISVLQEIISAENIKIDPGQVKLDSDLESIMITADKLHFSNVVCNILDNAIKYCKNAPQIVVSSYSKGENIVLEFIDNGIGIKKEEIEKLFKKFYRVSTGNVHDVKGFGLGLFYVYNICKAHGWDITVESEYEKGSKFSIQIPLNHG